MKIRTLDLRITGLTSLPQYKRDSPKTFELRGPSQISGMSEVNNYNNLRYYMEQDFPRQDASYQVLPSISHAGE